MGSHPKLNNFSNETNFIRKEGKRRTGLLGWESLEQVIMKEIIRGGLRTHLLNKGGK